MKYTITQEQYNRVMNRNNLTVPEQTLLGFLNRFLQGEKGEFENTPVNDLKKTMLFNSKTIYPMAQKLLEKKNTGKPCCLIVKQYILWLRSYWRKRIQVRKLMMIRRLTLYSWQWIKLLLKNKDMSSLMMPPTLLT